MKIERKWMIVIVVLVAVVALFFLTKKPKVVYDLFNPYPAVDSTLNQSVVEEGISVSAVVGSGTANQTIKYTQLVKDYEGRRIQFDINCQAIPANTTYKNNTKIMFDNRSGDARTFVIGGVKYNFPGYGYKILNISGSNLPAKVSFNCGSAVNVGSILIQN